jgi:membrane-associated phospholipid phosphatase
MPSRNPRWPRPCNSRFRLGRGLWLAAVLGLAGCGTLDAPRPWARDATFTPSVAALKRAARHAWQDPRTWLPAAGAALFAATPWDRRLSDWAVEQRPLFGSQSTAADASDTLRDLAAVGALGTALAAPGDGSLAGKGRGLALEAGAHFAAAGSAWVLKETVDRPRPDGSDHQSFPSGHSTAAFADVTLAQYNLGFLPLSATTRQASHAGLTALGVGTAWARLEAGVHYPSDVLAGAAIGHFMAAFVTAAFLGPSKESHLQLGWLPSRHGSRLDISLTF